MQSESGRVRKSFGELLSQLASYSVGLFRDEMELAKQEMLKKLKMFQVGLVMIVIGAIIGQIALIILCIAAVIGLAAFLGFGMSTLIIGSGLALIGGVVALSGLRQIRQTNFKPEKTIQTLKENKEWLKELTKELP